MARFTPEPPEHEIDLHGKKVEQALRHLEEVLTRLRVARILHLRIITGRGWGSPEGRARLKPAVKEWLSGPQGERLGVKEVREAARGGALDIRLSPPT